MVNHVLPPFLLLKKRNSEGLAQPATTRTEGERDSRAGSLALYFNITPSRAKAGFVCVLLQPLRLYLLYLLCGKKEVMCGVWAGAVAGWGR